MSRRPSWIVKLAARAPDVIERIVKKATGADDFTFDDARPLGCGLYGCAFAVHGTPWVVKVTTDEQEGRTWSYLERKGEELANEGKLIVASGIPRIADVKEVTRHVPRVRLRGETRRIFVVVREELDPYECEASQRGRRTPGAGGSRALHAGPPSPHTRSLARRGGPLTKAETESLDDAIDDYRSAGWSLGDIENGGGKTDKDAVRIETLRSRMRRAAGDLAECTATGRPLGLALREAAKDDCYLLDLHFGNVGWRKRAEVPGYPKLRKDVLVVLDPGQTTLPRAHRRSVTHAPNPPEPDDERLWTGGGMIDDDGLGWD